MLRSLTLLLAGLAAWPVWGQLEPDAPPVYRRAHPHEQPGALQSVDMTGERRRRDPFGLGQRAKRQPRAPLDQPEQRCLTSGDPELLGLTTQLAGQAEQHRAELVSKRKWAFGSLANH